MKGKAISLTQLTTSLSIPGRLIGVRRGFSLLSNSHKVVNESVDRWLLLVFWFISLCSSAVFLSALPQCVSNSRSSAGLRSHLAHGQILTTAYRLLENERIVFDKLPFPLVLQDFILNLPRTKKSTLGSYGLSFFMKVSF
jgi:hypothetical protein